MIAVLHQGSKSYWKNGMFLEILLVEHLDFGVIEVIAFEPRKQLETNRLFVDSTKLRDTLSSDEINGRVKESIETENRRKMPINRSEIAKAVMNNFVKEFLMNRIRPANEDMQIELFPSCDFVRPQPKALVPYNWVHEIHPEST